MYAIYGNMDPINIPQMLAYIPYMDPMGYMGMYQNQSCYLGGCIKTIYQLFKGLGYQGFWLIPI